MQAGKVQAKIFDYYSNTTKAGNLQVVIKFNTEDGERYTWYGGLTGKSVAFTLKTLIDLGMREANMEALELGSASGLLDMDTPVLLTIEMQDYQGQPRARVKYINKVGGQKFERAALPPEAKSALSNLNGDLMQAFAKANIAPKFDTDEKVPF